VKARRRLERVRAKVDGKSVALDDHVRHDDVGRALRARAPHARVAREQRADRVL
jgi:hypothetical protein